MKKIISAIAVLLCLMLSVPAFAGVEVVNESIGDLDFVYNTCLIEVPGRDGYGLADIQGNLLTEVLYYGFSTDRNYITAFRADIEGRNAIGLFNMDGGIVIPFEYGHIDVVNKKWALAYVLENATSEQYDFSTYDDEYFLIVRVDVYHLPDGAKMGEFSRDAFHEAYEAGSGLNIKDRATGVITTYDETFTAVGTVDSMYDDQYAPADYDTFYENGQYGIMDAAGNVILPPSYQYIYIETNYGDFATVSTGDKEGLIRLSTGEELLPAEFSRVRLMYGVPNPDSATGGSYERFGYYCVEVDEKIGYATTGGAITCQPKYSADIVDINGVSYMLTDLEGNEMIVAADGVETVVAGYNSIYALDYCSGVYYKVSNDDYMYGIIDWHGNEVLPCEYDSISVSSDGQYIILIKDYETYSLCKLTYSELNGQPETGDAPTTVIGGGIGGTETETATEPVDETDTEPVEETAVDYSTVKSLLTSAATLLSTDAAANGSAAVTLIENAAAQLADRTDVTGLLTSAVTLLNTDAAANGSAVSALIDSVLLLLQ